MPKLNETFWVIFKHCEAGFNLVNPVACCSVSRRTTATQTRLGRRPPLCVLPSKRLLLLCKILHNNTTGNTLWNSYITSSVILLKNPRKIWKFFNSTFKNHRKRFFLSGQKFIKNAKNGPFWRVFENLKLAGYSITSVQL